MINPNSYCEKKLIESGSNFSFAFKMLNPAQQQALTAVYAFCREVDDTVDEASDSSLASKKITWWCSEIDRVYQNKAQHPIGIALEESVQNFNLEKKYFDQMLHGMKMDLMYFGYETFEDLIVYCHCVASTAGLLAAGIFGFTDKGTLEYAKTLGLALQWINMIRDLGEDADRGRVYFPEVELKKFYLTPEKIIQKKDSENLRSFLLFQAERARNFYKKAISFLPICDRYKQRPGIIMAEIYFSLLNEIQKQDFAIFENSITLPAMKKIFIVSKTMIRERKYAKCDAETI